MEPHAPEWYLEKIITEEQDNMVYFWAPTPDQPRAMDIWEKGRQFLPWVTWIKEHGSYFSTIYSQGHHGCIFLDPEVARDLARMHAGAYLGENIGEYFNIWGRQKEAPFNNLREVRNWFVHRHLGSRVAELKKMGYPWVGVAHQSSFANYEFEAGVEMAMLECFPSGISAVYGVSEMRGASRKWGKPFWGLYLALARRLRKNRTGEWAIMLLGILGATLLYGDGLVTPVITVVSAVEGLNTIAPITSGLVLPISMVILISLFVFQRYGTSAIGSVFGPIMFIWFIVIGALGAISVCRTPGVLAALNPKHALWFLANHEWRNLLLTISAVFLALTGGEALYADMGHFGKRPIRLGWFFLVFPCVVLNYFGQGAHLLTHPNEVENLFYRLAPHWAMAAAYRRGKCRTRTHAIEVFRAHSLLEAWPSTDKTHQVRVHLAHAGCPVVADAFYGNGRGLYLSEIKSDYKFKTHEPERPLIGRVALHAESLTFAHPATHNELTVTAPWPKDLSIAIKYLKRFAPAGGNMVK